jgi:putative glutamine amidotransferase
MHIAVTGSIVKHQCCINTAYINYIIKGGYTPYVIYTKKEIEPALKICDGLLLPGGVDLDPMFYGYTNYASYSVNPEKDVFERAAFHAFKAENKPIFGICRGFQLIVLEFLDEFSEYDKVIKFVFHVESHAQIDALGAARPTPTHFVEYVPEYLYGKDGFEIKNHAVNSMHHQCLIEKYAGAAKDAKIKIDYKNFTKIAWTKHGLSQNNRKEAIVEAFSIKDWGGKILAVQWHPEELQDVALLHNIFGSENKLVVEKGA